MKTRDTTLKVRLNEDEAANLKAYAKQCGLTQSALLRMLIRGREPRPLPPTGFWEDMNILYELHGNLHDTEKKALETLIIRLQAMYTQPGKAVPLRGRDQDMGG